VKIEMKIGKVFSYEVIIVGESKPYLQWEGIFIEHPQVGDIEDAIRLDIQTLGLKGKENCVLVLEIAEVISSTAVPENEWQDVQVGGVLVGRFIIRNKSLYSPVPVGVTIPPRFWLQRKKAQ